VIAGRRAVEPDRFERATLCQRQVRLGQAEFRKPAEFDSLREPDFFLHGQEVGGADLMKVKPDRVADGRDAGLGGDRLVLRFRMFVGLGLLVELNGGGGRSLEDFNALGQEPAVQAIDGLYVIFGVRIHRHDVVRQNEPLIAALIKQTGDHR
jgi:hypothetical protein